MTLPGSGPISPKPVAFAQYNNHYNPSRLGFSSSPPQHVPGHLQSTNSSFPGALGNGLLNNLNNGLTNPLGNPNAGMPMSAPEEAKIYGLVMELLDSNTREAALLELSKKREQFDDLALVLWHSFGS